MKDFISSVELLLKILTDGELKRRLIYVNFIYVNFLRVDDQDQKA